MVLCMFMPSLCYNRVLFLIGERALRTILEDAMRVAERCVNPDDRERIVKAVGDIQSMVDALAELRSQGKVEVGSGFSVSLACMCRLMACMVSWSHCNSPHSFRKKNYGTIVLRYCA